MKKKYKIKTMMNYQGIRTLILLSLILFSFEVMVIKNPESKGKRLLDIQSNPPNFKFSRTEIYGNIIDFTIRFSSSIGMVSTVDLISEGYNLNFEEKEWSMVSNFEIKIAGTLDDTDIYEVFEDGKLDEKTFNLQVTFRNSIIYRYADRSGYQTITLVLRKTTDLIKFKGLINEIDKTLYIGKGYKIVEIENQLGEDLTYEVINKETFTVSQRMAITTTKISLQEYIGRIIVLVIYNKSEKIVFITNNILILDESAFSFSSLRRAFYIQGNVMQILEPKITLLNPASPHFSFLGGFYLVNMNKTKKIEFRNFTLKEGGSPVRTYNNSLVLTKDYIGDYYPLIEFAGLSIPIEDVIVITIREKVREIYEIKNYEYCFYYKLNFRLSVSEFIQNVEIHLYLEKDGKKVLLDMSSHQHYLLLKDNHITPGPALLYVYEGEDRVNHLEVYDIYFTDAILDPYYIFESEYKPWIFTQIKILNVGCDLSKAPIYLENPEFNDTKLICDFYENQTKIYESYLDCNWGVKPLKGVFNITVHNFFISEVVIYRESPVKPTIALPLEETEKDFNQLKLYFKNELKYYYLLFFITITELHSDNERYYKEPSKCLAGDIDYFIHETKPEETIITEIKTKPTIIYYIRQVVFFDYTLIDYDEELYRIGYLFKLQEQYVFIQKTIMTLEFEDEKQRKEYQDQTYYMRKDGEMEKLICTYDPTNEKSLLCNQPINIQVSTGYIGIGKQLVSSHTIHFVDYFISETCIVINPSICATSPIHLEIMTPVDVDPIVYNKGNYSNNIITDIEIQPQNEILAYEKYTYLYKLNSHNLIVGENEFVVTFDEGKREKIPQLLVSRRPEIVFGPPDKEIVYISEIQEFKMEVFPEVSVSKDISNIILRPVNCQNLCGGIYLETRKNEAQTTSVYVIANFLDLPRTIQMGEYDIYYLSACGTILSTKQTITLLYNKATHIILPAKHIVNECGLATSHRIYYRYPVQYYPPRKVVIRNVNYATVLEFGLMATKEYNALDFLIPANLPIKEGVYEVLSVYGEEEIPILEELIFIFYLYPIVIQPSFSHVPVGTTKIVHRLNLTYPIMSIQIDSMKYIRPTGLANGKKPIQISYYYYSEDYVLPGGNYVLEPSGKSIIVENRMDFIFENSTYKLRVYEFGTLEYSEYTYIAVDPPIKKKYLELDCGGLAKLGPNYCYVTPWEGYNIKQIQTVSFEKEDLIHHTKTNLVFCNPNSTLSTCYGAPKFEIAPNGQLVAIIQYSDSMLFKFKHMLIKIAENEESEEGYVTYNETDNHIFSDYYQFKEFFYLGKEGLDQLNNVEFDIISTERMQDIIGKLHYTVGNQKDRIAKCSQKGSTTKISCNFEFDKVTEATDIRVRFINETSDKFLHLIKGQLANDYCQLYRYREDIQFEILAETELYNFSLSLNDYTLSQSDLISISEYTNGRYKVKVQRDYFTDEYIEDFQVTLSSLVYDNTITLSDLDFHIIDTYATKFSGELTAQLEKTQLVTFTFNNKHENITDFYIEQKTNKIIPICKDVSQQNHIELIYNCDFNLVDITQIGDYYVYFKVDRCPNLLNLQLIVPIYKPPREIIDIQPRVGRLSIQPPTIEFTITYRYKLIESDIPDTITLAEPGYTYKVRPKKDLTLPSKYLFFDVVKKDIEPGYYEATTNYENEEDLIIKGKRILLYYNDVLFKEPYQYVWERYNMKDIILELKKEVLKQQINSVYIEFTPSRSNYTKETYFDMNKNYTFFGDSIKLLGDITYVKGNYTVYIKDNFGNITQHVIIVKENPPLYEVNLNITYPRPAKENDYNEVQIRGSAYYYKQINKVIFMNKKGEYVKFLLHDDNNDIYFKEEENYVYLKVFLEKDDQLQLIQISDIFGHNGNLKQMEDIYIRGYTLIKTLFIADPTQEKNTIIIPLDFYDSVARDNIKNSIKFDGDIQIGCISEGASGLSCSHTLPSSSPKDVKVTIFKDAKVTRIAQFITYSGSKNTCQYSDAGLTDFILTLHMGSNRGLVFWAYYEIFNEKYSTIGNYTDEYTYNFQITLTHDLDDSYTTTFQIQTPEDNERRNLPGISVKVIRETAILKLDEQFFYYNNSTSQVDMDQIIMNFTVRINEDDIDSIVFIDVDNENNKHYITDYEFGADIFSQYVLMGSFHANMTGKYYVTYIDGCGVMKEIKEEIYIIIDKTKNILTTISPEARQINDNEPFQFRYKEKLSDSNVIPNGIKLFHKNSGKESKNNIDIDRNSFRGELLKVTITNAEKELGLFRIQSIFSGEGYSELSPLHLLIYQNELKLKTLKKTFDLGQTINSLELEFENLIFIEQIHRIYLVEDKRNNIIIKKITDYSLKTSDNLGKVVTVNLGGIKALTTYTLQIIDRAHVEESYNFTIAVNEEQYYSFDIENDLFFLKDTNTTRAEDIVIKVTFKNQVIAENNVDNFNILEENCCTKGVDLKNYIKIPCYLEDTLHANCHYFAAHPNLPRTIHLSLGTVDVDIARRPLYLNQYRFNPSGFDLTQFLYVLSNRKLIFYLNNQKLSGNEFSYDNTRFAYSMDYNYIKGLTLSEGSYILYVQKGQLLEGEKLNKKISINDEFFTITHKKGFSSIQVDNSTYLQAGNITVEFFKVIFNETLFEGEVRAIRLARENKFYDTVSCELLSSNKKAVRCSINLEIASPGEYDIYYIDQSFNVYYLTSNIRVMSAFDLSNISPNIFDISEGVNITMESNHDDLEDHEFKGIRLVEDSLLSELYHPKATGYIIELSLAPWEFKYTGAFYLFSEFSTSSKNTKHSQRIIAFNGNDFIFDFEQLYFLKISTTFTIKVKITTTSSLLVVDKLIYNNNQSIICVNNICSGNFNYVKDVDDFTYTIKGYTQIFHVKEKMKMIENFEMKYRISEFATCSYYKESSSFNVTTLNVSEIFNMNRLHFSIYNVKDENEIYSYTTTNEQNYILDVDESKMSELVGKEFTFVVYERNVKNAIHKIEKVQFTNLEAPKSVGMGDNIITFSGASCAPMKFKFELITGKEFVDIIYDEIYYSNGQLILSISRGSSGFTSFGYYQIRINKKIILGKTFVSKSLTIANLQVTTTTDLQDNSIISIASDDYYLGRITQFEIPNISGSINYEEAENILKIVYSSCSIKATLLLIDYITQAQREITLGGTFEPIFTLNQTNFVYPKDYLPDPLQFTVYLETGYKASDLVVDGQSGKCTQMNTGTTAHCQIHIDGPTIITITYQNSKCFSQNIQIMTYSTEISKCLIMNENESTTSDVSVEMEVPIYVNENFKLKLNGNSSSGLTTLSTLVNSIKYIYHYNVEKTGTYELALEDSSNTKILSNLEIEGYNQFEVYDVIGDLKEWSNEQKLELTLSNSISDRDIPNFIYLKSGSKEVNAKKCNLSYPTTKLICYFNLENIGEGSYTLYYMDKCRNSYSYSKIIKTSKQNKLIRISPEAGIRNANETFTFTYENSVDKIEGVRINGKNINIRNKSGNTFTAFITFNAIGKYPIYTIYGNNKLTLEEKEFSVIERDIKPVLAENKYTIYQGSRLVRLTIPFQQQIDINDIASIVCNGVIFTSYYIDILNLIVSIPNTFTFSQTGSYIFEIMFHRTDITLYYTVFVREFNACHMIPISKYLYIRQTIGPMTIQIYAPKVTDLFIKFDLRYRSLKTDGNGTYYYTTSNLNEEIYIAFSYDYERTIYELERPIYLVDGIYRIFDLPMHNCWYIGRQFPMLKLRPGFNFDYSNFKLGIKMQGRNEIYDTLEGLTEGNYILQIYKDDSILYSGDLTLSGLSLYSPYSRIVQETGRIYFNARCHLGNDNIFIGDVTSPLKCSFDPFKSIYDCSYPYSLLPNIERPPVYYDNYLIGNINIIGDFLHSIFTFTQPDLIIRGQNIFEISSKYDLGLITKLIFANQNGRKYSYCNSGCDRTFTIYPSKLQFTLDFTYDTELYLLEMHNNEESVDRNIRYFNDILFKPEDISFNVDQYYYFSQADSLLPVKIVSNVERTLTINQIKLANGLVLSSSPCTCYTSQVCKIPINNFNYTQLSPESQYLQFYIDNYYYQSRAPILLMHQNYLPSLTYNNWYLSPGSNIIHATFNNEYIKFLYQYGLIHANVYHPTTGTSCGCSLLANENYVVNVQCPKAFLGIDSVIQLEIFNKIQNITIGGFCDQYQVPVVIGNTYSCQRCANYYLNGECYNKCPENYYGYNGLCVESCLTLNLYTQGNKCVSKCDESQGYGLNGKGDGFNLCIKCADNKLALLNGICTATCPSGYEVKNGKCAPITTCTGYCNNGDCQMVNNRPTCACSASYYGQTCQVCSSQYNVEIESILNYISSSSLSHNLLDASFGYDIILFLHMILQNNSTILSTNYELIAPKLIQSIQDAIGYIDDDNAYTILSSIMLLIESFLLKGSENRRLDEDMKIVVNSLKLYQEQRLKSNLTECQKEEDLFGNFILHRCPVNASSDLSLNLKAESEAKRRLDANYAKVDLKPCIEQLTNTEDLTSTYVGVEELESPELRNLVEVNNGGHIDKYYFSVYQLDGGNLNQLPINTCSNIGIITPFKGEFDVDTPYNYQYYNEKGINVFNASDAAFTELCYINDKLDFDLPQKYRQELYSMYSGEINQTLGEEFQQKCTIKEFDTKESLLSMICSLGGEKVAEEEQQQKSIISGEKNLVLKCANHVSLGGNVGFILFLFIVILGLVSVGFLIIIEFKHYFGFIPPKQLGNDGITYPKNSNTTNLPINEKAKTKDFQVTINKSTFLSTLKNNFFQLHPIPSLLYHSLISPMTFNVCFFIFSILSMFGFNAVYFSESYIKERVFASNRQSFGYPLTNEIGKIFLSIITTMCLSVSARAICLVKKEIHDQLKNDLSLLSRQTNLLDKDIIQRMNKFTHDFSIRRMLSAGFMLFFIVFFFYYCCVFCGIYRKAQGGWAASGFWALFFLWLIIAPLYISVISFIQYKFQKEKLVWYMKRLLVF